MATAYTPQIAEIVTFSLKAGVSDAAGGVTRQRSSSEDGIGADNTVWDSLETARDAAKGFMQQAFAPAPMGAINAQTMTLRHQKKWS